MPKNDATYDVVAGRTRILDDFRGDRVTGQVYRVIKTPQFGDPTEYEVTHSTFGEQCTCEGWRRHNKCKHLKMVEEFINGEHQDE